jgi:hypothetical protein
MAPFFVCTIPLLLVPASSPPRETPTLTVVWNDFYRLFPVNALELLGEELHRIFQENGLSVRLHTPSIGENLLLIPEPRVTAVVTDADPARFGLGRNTMAASVGERSKRFSVFVFLPAIRRTLGHDADPLPRRTMELTRAMARVLAHELVHVLAPERGHSETGLMSRTLTRRLLLSDSIELDRGSYLAAKARLESFRPVIRPSIGWI